MKADAKHLPLPSIVWNQKVSPWNRPGVAPQGLLKTLIARCHPRDSDSAGPGCGLRTCISNKLPGEADALRMGALNIWLIRSASRGWGVAAHPTSPFLPLHRGL